MTAWQQMTTEERITWLQSHVGGLVALIDTSTWAEAHQPGYQRFTPQWSIHRIREYDVSFGRGVLLDGEFWREVAEIADATDVLPDRWPEVPPPSGYADTSNIPDQLRHLIDACLDAMVASHDNQDGEISGELATPVAEHAIKALVTLGYTRTDLLQAWDATHP